MAEQGETLDYVIELQVDDEVLVDRIVGRAAEGELPAGGTARADDNAESLKIRLMAYYKQDVSADRVLPRKGYAERVRWPWRRWTA